MSYDFPNNPAIGQTVIGTAGISYRWDGAKWTAAPSAGGGSGGGTAYAPLASPVFIGDPQAPTPATADNDTSIATTAFVKAQGYTPLASPVFTGDPQAPTPATADNDTSIATTAFVKAQGYAPLASPVFTGDPQAPTPLTADSDTSIATTAFVKAQGYALLASPVFTGDPRAPTPLTADSDTSIATTAFVKAQGYALLASPVFTGDPQAPTPTAGDNDTSIATTAFVATALASYLPLAGGTLTGALTIPIGAQGTPSLNFAGNLTTGLYGAGTSVNITTAGAVRMALSTTAISAFLPIRVADGAVGGPGYAFNSESTSGLYRKGAGSLGLSILSADVMTWNTTGKTTTSLGVLAVNTTPPATALIGSVVASQFVAPAGGLYLNSYTTNGTDWLRYATGYGAWIGGGVANSFTIQLGKTSGAADSSIATSDVWTYSKGSVGLSAAIPANQAVPGPEGGWQFQWGMTANNWATNAYYDGANWRYLTAGPVAQTAQTGGNWTWQSAPSGAKDAVVTLTNRMSLDATGNLATAGNVGADAAVFAATGLFAGGDVAFGLARSGTTQRIIYFLGAAWCLVSEVATGTYTFMNGGGFGSTQGWIIRQDGYNYGAIGPTGGKGAYFDVSDERTKRDITPSEVGLEEILNIAPITFRRIGTSTPDRVEIGFSAQQLQTAIPDAVFELEPDLLAIQDAPIVAALVNGCKELAARVAALEAKSP